MAYDEDLANRPVPMACGGGKEQLPEDYELPTAAAKPGAGGTRQLPESVQAPPRA